jgi:hypothetical protein
MIKIIVEISEVKTEPDATNIAFRIEKEHPTEIEQFWESRVSPVLKDVLTRPGLLGDL